MAGRFVVGSAFVRLRTESRGLRAEMRAEAAKAAAGVEVEVEVGVDAGGMRSKVTAATKKAGAGQKIEVDMDVDTSGTRAKLRAFMATVEKTLGKINIDVGIDKSSMLSTAVLQRFSHLQRALGALHPMMVGFGAAIAGAAPYVAALGSHLTLAASAGFALLPVLGSLASAGLVTGLAFGGITEATDKMAALSAAARKSGKDSQAYKTALVNLEIAMEGLSEAGQDFARFIQDEISPAFITLRGNIQDAMLPQFQEAWMTLLPTFKVVTEGLIDMADAVGRLSVRFAVMMDSAAWRNDFARIGRSHVDIFDDLGTTILNVTGIFKDLYVAVLPQSERFAGWLATSSTRLNNIVDAAREDGRLHRFFQRAGDAAAQWGRILANITVTLFNIFSVINPQGAQLADNLEEITASWRRWTGSEEGQQKIRDFMNFMMGIDWGGIVKKVVALAAAFAGLSAVRGVAASLGLLLSPGGAIALGAAALITTLTTLYVTNDTFRDKVNATATDIREAIGPAFANFGDIMKEVGEALTPLAEIALDELGSFFQGLSTTLPGINEQLPGVAKSFGDFAEAFEQFSDSWEKLSGSDVGATLGVWFGTEVQHRMATLTFTMKQLTFGLEVATFQMRIFGEVFQTVSAATSAVWKSAWGEGGWARGLWGSFIGFMNSSFGLWRETFSSNWRGFTDFLSGNWNSAWNTIRGTWTAASNFIASGFNTWRTTFSNNWRGFTDFLSGMWRGSWNTIQGSWTRTSGAIAAGFAAWRSAFSNNWRAFTQFLSSKWGTEWNVMKNIWNSFRAFILSQFTTTTTRLKTMWKAMTDALSGWWRGLWNTVKGIWNGIKGLFSSTIPSAMNAFRDALKAIWDKVPGDLQAPINKVLDIFHSLLGKLAKIPGVGSIFKSAQAALSDKIGIAASGSSGPKRADGGDMGTQFSRGGKVRGQGTSISDSINARLSNEEYVVNAQSHRVVGTRFMNMLNKHPQMIKMMFPQGYAAGGVVGRVPGGPDFPSSPGAVRGDTGVWRGVVALAQKWGGNPNLTSGYRAGDPLWHGSGLAADLGGFNQDKLAGQFQAIGADMLELIHRTNSHSYGISRGVNWNIGANNQVLEEHRDHIHAAMTKKSVEHYLGQPIPTSIAGGGMLEKTWKKLALAAWGKMKGVYNKALAPLANVPFGPAAANVIKSIPDKLFTHLDNKDPGVSSSGTTIGPPPKGAIPAYFTYFGSNPARGFSDPNDFGLTASGVPPSVEGFSSPFWPLGTVADLTIGNKTKRLKQVDFGPALFVVDRHPGKAVLDFTWTAMQNMLGTVGNYDGYAKVVSFGSGRTYPGNFRPRGYEGGGKIPGTGNKDIQPALLAPGERVLTQTENTRLEAMAQARNSAPIYIEKLCVDAHTVKEVQEVQEFFDRISETARKGERRFK